MRKLKLISLVVAVIMVVSMLPLGMVSAFAATEAEQNADLVISTPKQFADFMADVAAGNYNAGGKLVVLKNDIDMVAYGTANSWSWPLLDNSTNTNYFAGTLDGQGHTLTYTATYSGHNSAPFGHTLAKGKTATFQNITLTGTVNCGAKWQKGGLYYTAKGATLNLTNVNYDVDVLNTNGDMGGVISSISAVDDVPSALNITNCVFTNTAQGVWNGAIAGVIQSVGGTCTVTVTDTKFHTTAWNTRDVAASDNISGVGGIVHSNAGTTSFTNCEFSGIAEHRQPSMEGKMMNIAGFVSTNSGTLTIQDCVMSGTVLTKNHANMGGFVGYNSGSVTIDDSVMMGRVENALKTQTVTTVQMIGGFIGSSNSGTLTITDSAMMGYVKTNDNTSYKVTKTGGIAGYTRETVTLTNIAMYGTVEAYHDMAGAIGGELGGTTSVNYVIHAGRVWEGSGRSGRFIYGGSVSNTSCYNIQFGSHTYGATPHLAGGSSYTIKKGDSFIKAPYSLSEANYAALHAGNFDATINGLTTYDSTQADAFATEKATALTNYKANWTFYEAGLPVPNGCKAVVDGMVDDLATIDSEQELNMFASLLAGGYAFVDETVKLATDVTYNAGWDAFAETVTRPETVWPISVGDRKFAGTFDGQGHTISGIYLNAYVEGVGIFGNIATGTTGTVKNLKVVNSYVQGNAEGVGAIFGEVDNETTTTKLGNSHVIQTKAIVDNVYVDANVVSNGSGNTNLGAGGIIGGSRADVVITNTAFVGKVTSKCRGVAAFVGAVRPYQASSINHYLNTITVENSYANAELIGLNSNKQTFVGGIVGYSNAQTTTHNVTNVILNNTISGNQHDGYIYGGAWCGADTGRDGVTKDYQYWNLTNVKYVATTGTATKAVGNAPGGSLYNGVAFNTANFPATAEADLPKILYTFASDMSLTLTDGLAVNVYTDKADVILNAANTGDIQADINGEKVTAVEDGNAYKFTYTGILPQQLADDVTITLGAVVKTTSVKAYLIDLLDDAEAQDVAADLLRYGAAAQTYCDYAGEAIMDPELEAAIEDLGTTFATPDAPAYEGGSEVTSVALRLENTLALIGNNGTTVAVNASEMDENKTVGDASCSVAAYVEWAVTGGVSDAEELALIKAIYAYGMSAKAYN